jgi:hypothetical protein
LRGPVPMPTKRLRVPCPLMEKEQRPLTIGRCVFINDSLIWMQVTVRYDS